MTDAIPVASKDQDIYTVVVYLQQRPPTAPILDDEQQVALDAQHIKYVTQMRAAGKLLHSGRFDGGGGLSIYACSPQETAELLSDDPYLAEGHRVAEIYTWRTRAGVMSFTNQTVSKRMEN
jgi:uncharacterized protein YciI